MPQTARAQAFLAEKDARKRTATLARRTSSRVLGSWIDRVAQAIQAARDQGMPTDKRQTRPAWLEPGCPCVLVDSRRLALVVCDAVLRPRRDDPDDWEARELPSFLTVAGEIGRSLGINAAERQARKADRERVGMELLSIAHDCGLIGPLRPVLPRGQKRTRESARVQLSEAAAAQLGEIYTELTLAADAATDQAQFAVPEPLVEVTPNRDGLVDPPVNTTPGVIAALNLIQRTAWRINKPLLDRLVGARNPVAETRRAAQALRDARRAHARAKRNVSLARKAKRSSQTISKLLAEREKVESHRDDKRAALRHWLMLVQATALQDKAPFYFRHRFDYRGRIYSVGGMLNYTGGDDLARALLEFHQGEVCAGPNFGIAAMMLSMHLTSMWGHGEDKAPFQTRLNWAHLNTARLIAHADGERFDPKLEAAEPHRFLAACIAWQRAKRGESVHLPVVFDATSSGLQVYSWLMRDRDLGARVNTFRELPAADPGVEGVQLAPVLHAPADLYAEVGAVAGESDRDAVKKLVIPQIYGAGPAKQARILTEYLRKPGRARPAVDDDEIKRRVASVRGALLECAPAFRLVSRWLRRCAQLFSDKGAPFAWTLPDGFEVLQDSRVIDDSRSAAFYLPHGKVSYTCRRPTQTVDERAQGRQVAANYVHSLDGAYLREVVRQGASSGVTGWALAHDSFGALPTQALTLRAVLAPAVVAIYGASALMALREQFARQGCFEPPSHEAELDAGFLRGDLAT